MELTEKEKRHIERYLNTDYTELAWGIADGRWDSRSEDMVLSEDFYRQRQELRDAILTALVQAVDVVQRWRGEFGFADAARGIKNQMVRRQYTTAIIHDWGQIPGVYCEYPYSERLKNLIDALEVFQEAFKRELPLALESVGITKDMYVEGEE